LVVAIEIVCLKVLIQHTTELALQQFSGQAEHRERSVVCWIEVILPLLFSSDSVVPLPLLLWVPSQSLGSVSFHATLGTNSKPISELSLSRNVHEPCFIMSAFMSVSLIFIILGAAEMLAMEMKASGMYVSRGLSFRQAEVLECYCTEC